MKSGNLVLSIGLIAATWAVYHPVTGFDFVNFDDNSYVSENETVLTGLSAETVRWAFSLEPAVITSNWHPLTWLSLMLDTELFGTDAGGYHLTNLLFHIANVLLLFVVLREMTGATYRSALVALLFGIHPSHVESVAWISERKDVLSTCLGLMSILAYVRYTRRSSGWWYAVSITMLIFSLMAKQMFVTLPFALLLLDYWPLGRLKRKHISKQSANSQGESDVDADCNGLPSNGDGEPADFKRHVRWLLIEKIPFFIVIITFCAIAVAAQENAIVPLKLFSMPQRLANVVDVYGIYVIKTIWPTNLAVFYPHPDSISSLSVAFSASLLCAITFVCLKSVRLRPYLIVGWLWYLGTLVPVIGIVQVGSQRMADRYTYVPSIGLFMMAAWCFPAYASLQLRQRVALCVPVLLLLLAYLIVAHKQVGHWRDSKSLYERAAAVTVGNDLAHYNLADIYHQAGDFTNAVYHYRKVLGIHPQDAAAHDGLGLALTKLGFDEQACGHFQTAIELEPTTSKFHNNLGLALYNLGRLDEAEKYYRESIRLDSKSAIAHYNLANLLGDRGRFDEAIDEFQATLAIEPKNAKAHNNLGLALFIQERFDESIEHFEATLKIDPQDALAHYNLGRLFLRQGQRSRAIEHLREAVRLQPNFAEAQAGLNDALQE